MLCLLPSRRLGAEPPARVVRRMRKDFAVVLERSSETTGRNQASGTGSRHSGGTPAQAVDKLSCGSR